LQWAGVVVGHPASLVTLGDLGSRPVLVSLAVLALTCVLMVYRVRGAILLGILFGVVVAVPLGIAKFHGIFSGPPSLAPTFLAFTLEPLFESGDLWIVVFVLLFLDVFDTMGTLVGVAYQGGFLKDGQLPRARAAFTSDAIGTVGGVCLGTTTVTSFIESATGIAVGGRTGLTAVTCAVLFLLSIFLYPLVRTIGEGYVLTETVTLYPLTAPALIIVGSFMMRSAGKIEWDDPIAALPAFLTMLTIPLTFSITEGIAFGFVSSSLLYLLSGRLRESHPLLHIISVLFLVRWLFF
jgi:AGZA family xanthine/uracil permease-like MFS transporter